MTRIFLLIRALGQGGAERQVIELAKALDKTRFQVTVATFYDGGALRPEIEHIPGVQVISLHKTHRWDIVPFLWRAMRAARAARPQVIQAYMGGPNELALLLGTLCGAQVIWGLRVSNLDLAHYDWAARAIFQVGARLSRFADLIIANSHAGKQHHLTYGYQGARMLVIPNGIDTTRFCPDAAARQRTRAAWGVGETTPLLGVVARLDPMKDHANFLRAAVPVLAAHPEVRLVCVGDGPEPYKQQLRALAQELGIAEALIWAGPSTAMPTVYNALDILVSPSAFGEGFSNVIGEAMACGVPCAVTDVGDAAWIVEDTGRVVPAQSPAQLSTALLDLVARPAAERTALGLAARARITRHFSTQVLATEHEQLYTALLTRDHSLKERLAFDDR